MAEKWKYEYSYFEKIDREIQKINSESFTEESIINGLLDLLREHDFITYNHTLIVADLAFALAQETGLTAEECLKIKKGALLHDIGKLFVPQAILRRHNGDYVSEKQMELLKSHGKMGEDIIHSFINQDGVQKLDSVYGYIADQHNIGIGSKSPTQSMLDSRHKLVEYISIADFMASTLDKGKTSIRTFNFEESVDRINSKFDRSYFSANLKSPFNRLMGRYGILSFNTQISSANLGP